MRRQLALITKRDVAQMLHVHPESVMRLVRNGKFPAPIRLQDKSGSRLRWDLYEIEAWVDASKASASR